MPTKTWTLVASSGKARAGTLTTMTSTVKTPAFMPIATRGYFRSLPVELVEACGAQLGLCNALHIMMSPGAETIQNMGGIKEFMHWNGAILTDSGGYQVMSLASMGKMSEEGMTVKNPRDGRLHMLSPETSIQTQCLIGSDVVMILDVCTSHPHNRHVAQLAMERSLRWAKRCCEVFAQKHLPQQQIFGIVQGGIYEDLRNRSLESLVTMGFDGFALGGLCVGEPLETTHHILTTMLPRLPQEKARYIMGMGQPWDLLRAVSAGADLFDCVLPTRNGRHGHLYTWDGVLNVTKTMYRGSAAYPDEDPSHRPLSWKASLGFLHHLFKSHDPLAGVLGSWWNVFFYQQLMSRVRQNILEDNIADYTENLLAKWQKRAPSSHRAQSC